MIQVSARATNDESRAMFREQVRKFCSRELVPNIDRWERERIIDRDFWRACGDAGLLCLTMPAQYGGMGVDFSYNAIVDEEFGYHAAASGITLQSDIVADYILNYASEEIKARWLPRLISGEIVSAIAMTEPGAGSDLQAIKTTAKRLGCEYVISGAKTYISNGQNADLIIVAAKTNTDKRSKGTSLILVEADRDGFARGRNLDKIGQHASDTSELFFHEVKVPISNLLGEEEAGFGYMMAQLPQERLSIAITAHAGAQRAFDEALNFTKVRKAFGKTVFEFQNTRFTLAELATQLQAGWAHLDWAVQRHVAGRLTTAEASSAKLFHTELQWRCCDAALQLHGGAGYMNEYLIARLWRDARVTRIFGGTSEIMKEIIARSL